MNPISRIAIVVLLFSLAQAPTLNGQRISPLEAYRSLRTADSIFESGEPAAAIPAYEQVVANDSLHAAVWYRLGRSYEAAQRWRDAANALERAHALGYQDLWWIAQRIALHRARLGEPELALDWIQTSLSLRHENRPGLAEDFPGLAGLPRFERLLGAVPDSLNRVSGWRHDLGYLVEEARRLHAGPDRPAWSPRFEALADSIHDQIPEMEDGEVILALQRLVVLLEDGHSTTYPFLDNRLGLDFPSLPVVFYQFDEGLFVVAGEGEGESLIASRVTAIGGLDPDEVMRRIGPYVNQDNAITPLWLGVRFYLPSTPYLAAVGATEDIDRAVLTVVTPGGEERRVALRSGDHTFPRKLRHPATATAAAPVWLQDVDTPFRIEHRPAIDALYLPFNQVRDAEDGPTLAAFADSMRAELQRTGASNLILDVRHNNGGNAGLLGPFLRALVWWEQDRPDHRLWILTGRNTFSAAQIFIGRAERWTEAIFVGERSSSSPNFTGEETTVVLPWSGLRGSISSRYNQESDPMDERAWIDVDLRVPLTAADYFAGRDPVMEAVERAIGPDDWNRRD